MVEGMKYFRLCLTYIFMQKQHRYLKPEGEKTFLRLSKEENTLTIER